MHVGAVLFALAMLIAPTAYAQTAAAAVPEAMPFDNPYGAAIGLDQAHKAIIAAVNEATKHNWKMAISVVDQARNLVAHATMDGTQYASIDISQVKARTAALLPGYGGVPDRSQHGRLAIEPQSAGVDAWRGEQGWFSDRFGRQADRCERREWGNFYIGCRNGAGWTGGAGLEVAGSGQICRVADPDQWPYSKADLSKPCPSCT